MTAIVMSRLLKSLNDLLIETDLAPHLMTVPIS
jgi:hypothetical protein